MQPEENALLVRYQKDPNMVYREIAGEALLVPIRSQVSDLSSIFTLNETASAIWKLVDGNRTLQDIVDAMVEEYEIDEPQAAKDILELIAQLETAQAVQKII